MQIIKHILEGKGLEEERLESLAITIIMVVKVRAKKIVLDNRDTS